MENLASVRWLKCAVDRGMFSDEMTISYPIFGAARTSVFVPASDVQGRPGELGKVRVLVTQLKNSLLAVLPTSYQDSVTVSEGDLTEVP